MSTIFRLTTVISANLRRQKIRLMASSDKHCYLRWQTLRALMCHGKKQRMRATCRAYHTLSAKPSAPRETSLPQCPNFTVVHARGSLRATTFKTGPHSETIQRLTTRSQAPKTSTPVSYGSTDLRARESRCQPAMSYSSYNDKTSIAATSSSRAIRWIH